jgi:hypothetical protein
MIVQQRHWPSKHDHLDILSEKRPFSPLSAYSRARRSGAGQRSGRGGSSTVGRRRYDRVGEAVFLAPTGFDVGNCTVMTLQYCFEGGEG